MGKPSTDTEGDTEALVMGEGLQKLDIKRSAVLSANELVGTGFASRCRLKPSAEF